VADTSDVTIRPLADEKAKSMSKEITSQERENI
jgi:hypothetical protein